MINPDVPNPGHPHSWTGEARQSAVHIAENCPQEGWRWECEFCGFLDASGWALTCVRWQAFIESMGGWAPKERVRHFTLEMHQERIEDRANGER